MYAARSLSFKRNDWGPVRVEGFPLGVCKYVGRGELLHSHARCTNMQRYCSRMRACCLKCSFAVVIATGRAVASKYSHETASITGLRRCGWVANDREFWEGNSTVSTGTNTCVDIQLRGLHAATGHWCSIRYDGASVGGRSNCRASWLY